MSDTSDIVEITEPIDLAIVDDRLHFTCISGRRRRTYSVSFHKARSAAHIAVNLLDERQRISTVRQIRERG